MIKQGFGFALFGSVVAVLGALLMQTAGPSKYTGYSAASSFTGPQWAVGPWALPALTAVVGAALGLVTGVVLFICGIRVAADSDNRVGRVVVAGVVGVALGLSPTLTLVGVTFAGLQTNESIAISPEALLTLYAVSAALGYTFALIAIRIVLRSSKDSRAGRTTKTVAAFLPGGAVLATAAGVGVAWLLGFTTTVPTLVAVVLTVVVVLAATFALARARALRVNGI